MTFNVNVPNSAQSPSLFPSQANTNNQRLKDIINADHNFVDTFAANQGAHKQVSYINRASPVTLPSGINAISYTKDVNGVPQKFFYNGVTDIQVTPGIEQISATLTVPVLTTSAAILTLTDSAFATIFVCNQALVTSYKYYLVFKTNNTGDIQVVLQNSSGSTNNVGAVTALAGSPATQVGIRNLSSIDVQTYFYTITVQRL